MEKIEFHDQIIIPQKLCEKNENVHVKLRTNIFKIKLS